MNASSKVSSDESIKDVELLVKYFNPRGFVKRHESDCTRIIINLLEDKDPFDGFVFE